MLSEKYACAYLCTKKINLVGMTNNIIEIKSITQLHEMLGYEKPKHPLISVIDVSKLIITEEFAKTKVSANFYYIGLKNAACGFEYGRNNYDFEEGVLAFTAPNQIIAAKSTNDFDKEHGWMLFFHPDLIRNTPLGENIEDFSFFNYEANEALHLSEKEKQTLNDCIQKIREEYSESIDSHSQRVIVSSLELLLNYCLRFYERQFHTRFSQNKDIVTRVNNLLKEYYQTGQLPEYGPPSLMYLGEKVNLSPTYLSDLLRNETGRSAKEHINDFLIDKAKNLLLSTEDSVAEISYSLGFNYPHYFSRLFKTKTGITPQKYRETTN